MRNCKHIRVLHQVCAQIGTASKTPQLCGKSILRYRLSFGHPCLTGVNIIFYVFMGPLHVNLPGSTKYSAKTVTSWNDSFRSLQTKTECDAWLEVTQLKVAESNAVCQFSLVVPYTFLTSTRSTRVSLLG